MFPSPPAFVTSLKPADFSIEAACELLAPEAQYTTMGASLFPRLLTLEERVSTGILTAPS